MFSQYTYKCIRVCVSLLFGSDLVKVIFLAPHLLRGRVKAIKIYIKMFVLVMVYRVGVRHQYIPRIRQREGAIFITTTEVKNHMFQGASSTQRPRF